MFAAGPPASILLFALAPDAMIGWTTPFRPAERPFVPERYADLPTLGRLTGRGSSANVESVIAAKPDLVFDYGTVNPTYVSLADRVQAQAGIPYLLIDGAFDRIDGASRCSARCSAAARKPRSGRATRPSRWPRSTPAWRAFRRRAARACTTRAGRGVSTRRWAARSTPRPSIASGAQRRGGPRRGGLAQVSIEQVLALESRRHRDRRPQHFNAVWRDPLWQRVTAVREGRVYLAPGVPFGWIDFPPSVNRLIGLRWLARALYPEVFPEDLRPAVRDFFGRAYHQTPTDAQLDALLATSERRRT